MCKADLNLLCEVINQHIGQELLLDEWAQMINVYLPPTRKLNLRELAFAIRVLQKKHMVVVERGFKRYLFQACASQFQPIEYSLAQPA